jgi:hypothetical protein
MAISCTLAQKADVITLIVTVIKRMSIVPFAIVKQLFLTE